MALKDEYPMASEFETTHPELVSNIAALAGVEVSAVSPRLVEEFYRSASYAVGVAETTEQQGLPGPKLGTPLEMASSPYVWDSLIGLDGVNLVIASLAAVAGASERLLSIQTKGDA